MYSSAMLKPTNSDCNEINSRATGRFIEKTPIIQYTPITLIKADSANNEDES